MHHLWISLWCDSWDYNRSIWFYCWGLVRYKPPKYILFYIYFFFVVYIFLFHLPNDLEKIELGTYELEKQNETKLDLNIYNVKELELEILETFVSSTLKKCNIQEIFVFGSIQSYNNLVRIRIEDVRVSGGLNIENKNEAKNDRVFNYQDPINITSNSFNCLNEKIIIEFENEINIQYLRIIQDANDLFQNVKIININGYS